MHIIFHEKGLLDTEVVLLIMDLKNSLKNNKQNSILLLAEIVSFGKNMDGESKVIIEELFSMLELDNFAMKILDEGSWVAKVLCIQNLSLFKVAASFDLILNFIDDENSFIRDESQLAAIKIGEENALNFVYDLKSDLSEWQQIRLIESLRKLKFPLVPDYKRWFGSQNKSVILFGFKVIVTFNHFDGLIHLKKFFNHEDEQVTIQLLQAIKSMQVPFFNTDVIALIGRSESKIKIKAIRTLAVTFNEEDFEIAQFLNSNDHDLFFEGVKFCQINLKEEVEKLINNVETEEWKLKILEHSGDRRIN